MRIKGEILHNYTDDVKTDILYQLKMRKGLGEELYVQFGYRKRESVLLEALVGKIYKTEHNKETEQVFIYIELLDTPMAKQVQNLLNEGTPLYLGAILIMKGNEPYELIGIDIVADSCENDEITIIDEEYDK